MGLLQRACETYDANCDIAGVYREGHEVLPPVAHMLTSANIEIMLNENGQFIQANVVPDNESSTVIPVTEASMGRTSGGRAHPLCDKWKYIAPIDQEKHALYLTELEKWMSSNYSHPFLNRIYTYVISGSIIDDMESAGLQPKDDDFFRWRVTGVQGETEACWKNHSLQAKFIEYYLSQIDERPNNVCMITGLDTKSAEQHAKGIVPLHGNAKLISSQKDANFTYRGRFTNAEEAYNVSFLASQKAHNALRWLMGEQKRYFGGKAFLCWNPNGYDIPQATDPFGYVEEHDAFVDIDAYSQKLKQTLAGYKASLPDNEPIVIVSLDAATTGRLSLNYYNEMPASDFLLRLYNWDENCCWYFGKKGLQAPTLANIVNCAFGTERTEKGTTKLETDDRVFAQQIQRLLACRINKASMPSDIKEAICHKVSSPLSYEPGTRDFILSTACAVIKKYDYDRKGVIWEMALKPDKLDLSYQYGRLLAVLEKAEADTYERDSKRETNAIRMQAVFARRPRYASTRILEQLKNAYFPRLSQGSRIFYERLISDIFSMIDEFPEQLQDRPLQDSYLMGYYLQRKELWQSNKQDNKNENEEDE